MFPEEQRNEPIDDTPKPAKRDGALPTNTKENVMIQGATGTPTSDTMIGTASNEWLLGREGDDFIDGRAGNDRLFGEAGNDVLLGGTGNDRLLGGDDKDLLNGGWHDDILTGGNHADTFAFDLVTRGYGGYERPTSPGNDVITDFTNGEDMLQFNMVGGFENLDIGQVGADTVIKFDEVGGSVTLTGIDMHTLDASDFYFL